VFSVNQTTSVAKLTAAGAAVASSTVTGAATSQLPTASATANCAVTFGGGGDDTPTRPYRHSPYGPIKQSAPIPFEEPSPESIASATAALTAKPTRESRPASSVVLSPVPKTSIAAASSAMVSSSPAVVSSLAVASAGKIASAGKVSGKGASSITNAASQQPSPSLIVTLPLPKAKYGILNLAEDISHLAKKGRELYFDYYILHGEFHDKEHLAKFARYGFKTQTLVFNLSEKDLRELEKESGELAKRLKENKEGAEEAANDAYKNMSE